VFSVVQQHRQVSKASRQYLVNEVIVWVCLMKLFLKGDTPFTVMLLHMARKNIAGVCIVFATLFHYRELCYLCNVDTKVWIRLENLLVLIRTL